MEIRLLSDNELVDLINDNDASAFEVLYRRYWKKLVLIALDKTQDEDLAKEIIQELFVELWE